VTCAFLQLEQSQVRRLHAPTLSLSQLATAPSTQAKSSTERRNILTSVFYTACSVSYTWFAKRFYCECKRLLQLIGIAIPMRAKFCNFAHEKPKLQSQNNLGSASLINSYEHEWTRRDSQAEGSPRLRVY
jgi:hypothetical protein